MGLFYIIFLNWRIVNLQCCISFRFIAKWFHIYIYMYMPNCFPEWPHHFEFASRINKSSCYPTSMPDLILSVFCILHIYVNITFSPEIYIQKRFSKKMFRKTRTGRTYYQKTTLSVQFSSVTQSCLTLCDLMDRSTSGLAVHHQLLEFT